MTVSDSTFDAEFEDNRGATEWAGDDPVAAPGGAPVGGAESAASNGAAPGCACGGVESAASAGDAVGDGDFARLVTSFTQLTDTWTALFPVSQGVLEDDLAAASQETLLDFVDVASAHHRQLSAMLAVVAQEIADRCRLELCDQRLDFQYGYRSASQFLADCLQIERRDAQALTKVGKAIIGEPQLTGERVPPQAEVVADAVRAGELGFTHANEIVKLTQKLGKKPEVDADELAEGEQLLVDIACEGLPLTEFRGAISHLEAYLDPDGVAPSLEAQRQQSRMTFRNEKNGMVGFSGMLDVERGAYLRHAVEAYTTATIRACRGHNHPGAADPDHPDYATNTAAAGETAEASTDFAAEGGPVTHPAPEELGEDSVYPVASFRDDLDKDPYRRDQVATETRSIPQIQADALVDMVKHVIGCDLEKLPGLSTTVIVRMGLEDVLPPEVLAELMRNAAAGNNAGDVSDADDASDAGDAGDAGDAKDSNDAEAGAPGSADAGASGSGLLDAAAVDVTGTNHEVEARDSAAAFRRKTPTGTATAPRHLGTGYPAREHTGIATIDGGTIIDVGTARRLAAGAGVIPIVLAPDSVCLDMGREARHFTKWQRYALVERDGGCAFCGLPPGMTEAHHIAYWTAHNGKTDLDNGILLCSSCHRRVHAGWEIRIVHDPARSKRAAKLAKQRGGGTVWFIPPAHVDPLREPRLGGRKRFDLGYRKAHPPVPIPGYENMPWDNRGPTFRPKT